MQKGTAPQAPCFFLLELYPHRHCERSEAIQSLTAEAVWIASLRSQ
ncbi:hypothetical protein AB7M16_002768 [Bradyrhizobium sp. USDA 372]